MGFSVFAAVLWGISPIASVVVFLFLFRFRGLTPEFPLILIGLALEIATGAAQSGFSIARTMGFDLLGSQYFGLFFQGTAMIGLAGRVSLLVGLVLVFRQLDSRLSFLTQIVESGSDRSGSSDSM